MKIAIGSDHAGFEIKEEIKSFLTSLNTDFIDLGAHEFDSLDDYPDYAKNVGYAVRNNDVQKGIIVCGSGVGASIAANKMPGVRASICHDLYSASQGVEHDDLNVLCLGARIVDAEFAKGLIQAFLSAEFTAEERHSRRVGKIIELERNGPQIVNKPQGG